ncbi:MAG TPA: PEP-CTERM sorting domain-containing protein [Fimbriimonadaceae bacterium]|nr:PEP-CTERM sorting domain-containing protein [Fimbriimonadaceae bacterium]
MKKLLSLFAFAAAASFGTASVYFHATVDIDSMDLFGDSDNVVHMVDLGGGSAVMLNTVSWDVLLYADSPSYLSEIAVAITDTGLSGYSLTPGVGDNFPGSDGYVGGPVAIPLVLADGFLRLEFFEWYDDFIDDWYGIWEEGGLTFDYTVVPEPASMIALGSGAVALMARRRRK